MRAVEWLRPFVASEAWDYCVAWKLGDDPSRFFEWIGCCCIGGGGGGGYGCKTEDESQMGYCKDATFQHPVMTKACQALSNFPAYIPLYEGVHGEVVMAGKTTWIYQSSASKAITKLVLVYWQEFLGTQVLIPINCGLIELFAFRHIAEDDITGVLIPCEFRVADAYPNASGIDELSLEDQLQISMPFLQLLQQPQLQKPNVHSNLKGSSSGSFFSKEHQVFVPYAANNMKMPVATFSDSGKDMKSRADKIKPKNSMVERRRRAKIKQLLYTLRALVPKISKMDRAAILEDAIEYIVELEKELKRLQDELKEIEEEECTKSKERTPHETPELQLEVNQIKERDFLLKILHEEIKGGCGKLMDAIFSLGLQVVDANIITSNGKVLNILRVQAINEDLQPEKLTELLIRAIMSRIQQ